MPPSIAAAIFAIGILVLFVLDRQPSVRTSVALWIPVIWVLINGSRPISLWMQSGRVVDSPSAILDGSPLDALVYGILIAASIFVIAARRQQVGALLRANGPVLVFFLYCGISVLWSDFPFVAFKRWTKSVGELIVVLTVLTEPEPVAAIGRLVKRAGLLLLPISILLIKYYPMLGRGYSQWDGTLFNVGVATNKNLLGMICLILGLGALWRFLKLYRSEKSSSRTRQMLAQGVVMGIAIWLLWEANSVTSFSCFAMAGGLMVVTSFSAFARKRTIIHILVIAMIAVTISALFFQVGGGVLEGMGRNSTLTGRTEIWRLVLSIAGNPLIGTGFESFWLGDRLNKVWDIYWFHLNEAHNGYLEVFLNLGWIGITLLAVMMMTGYRNIISSFQQNPEEAGLRLAYFITATIYSFTEAGFRMMSPVWFFFLLVVVNKPTVAVPDFETQSQVVGYGAGGSTKDPAESAVGTFVGATTRKQKAGT
jgi:exopolysaccharide production protein ExoQ